MKKIRGLLVLSILFFAIIHSKEELVYAGPVSGNNDTRDAYQDYGDDYTSWYVDVVGDYKSVAIELDYNGGCYAGSTKKYYTRPAFSAGGSGAYVNAGPEYLNTFGVPIDEVSPKKAGYRFIGFKESGTNYFGTFVTSGTKFYYDKKMSSPSEVVGLVLGYTLIAVYEPNPTPTPTKRPTATPVPKYSVALDVGDGGYVPPIVVFELEGGDDLNILNYYTRSADRERMVLYWLDSSKRRVAPTDYVTKSELLKAVFTSPTPTPTNTPTPTPGRHTVKAYLGNDSGYKDSVRTYTVIDGQNLMALSEVKATPDGRRLMGWFMDPDLKKPIALSTCVFEDMTLYAAWEIPGNWSVFLDYCGGCDSDGNETGRYEISYTESDKDTKTFGNQLISRMPGMSQHVFVGWFTSENGTGSEVKPETRISDNTTLYAAYRRVKYVVTLDYNGGELYGRNYYRYEVDIDGACDFGTNLINYRPMLGNEECVGWYTTPGCIEGTEAQHDTPVTDDTVLYALYASKCAHVAYAKTGEHLEECTTCKENYMVSEQTCVKCHKEGPDDGECPACSCEHDYKTIKRESAQCSVCEERYIKTVIKGCTKCHKEVITYLEHECAGKRDDSDYAETKEPEVSPETPDNCRHAFTVTDRKSSTCVSCHESFVMSERFVCSKCGFGKYEVYYHSCMASSVTFYGTGCATCGMHPEEDFSVISCKGSAPQSLDLYANEPAMKGHKIVGWSTAPDGRGTVYKAGYRYVFDGKDGRKTTGEDLSLYAIYADVTYTITFDYSVSTLGISADSLVCGETKRQIKTGEKYGIFPGGTCKGFTLIGWYSAYYGRVLMPEDTHPCYDDLVLNAVWESTKSTVKIDGNFPSDMTMSGANMYHGTTFTAEYAAPLSKNTPLFDYRLTCTGYNFEGFRIGDRRVNGDTIVDFDSDCVLTGVWSPKSYYYYLDMGEGSGITRSTMYGSAYDLPTDLRRVGYTFDGWYTMPKGKGEKIENGAVNRTPYNTTLYANWISNEYTITFDYSENWKYPARDLVGNEKMELHVRFNQMIDGLPKPERTGYDFIGWSTRCIYDSVYEATNGYVYVDDNGKSSLVGDLELWKYDSDKTLYAVWEPKTIIVTYDYNYEYTMEAPLPDFEQYD